MTRAEFSKKTKRQALDRSGNLCEAIGKWYGLAPGERCKAPLSFGVEFDHIDLEANSGDASLKNCAAVCPGCHKHKTAHRDIPVAAKTLRQQDKARGIKGDKKWARPMGGTIASGWKRPFGGGPAVRR